MIDLVQDVANLTSVPKEKLDKFVDKAEYAILDALDEATKTGKDDIIELDIGIGTLQLINKDVLEYRFVPSRHLEKAIVNYFETYTNPLENTLEKTLSERILKVYKEIL